MRASRQTELQREFPLHVVCSWLGNSPFIAQQSYLLVIEDDFAKAAGLANVMLEDLRRISISIRIRRRFRRRSTLLQSVFVSMGLVPIGRQSQPACERNAFPITTRVYPRRMMIRWYRVSSNPTPVAKPPSVPPKRGSSPHVGKPHDGGVA
jgi:hypothetical protein